MSALWCPARLLTPLFVFFDLGAFLVQLLGAGMVGSAYSVKDITAQQRQQKMGDGLRMLRLGLGLQLVCFSAFAVISVRFIVVSRRWNGEHLRRNARMSGWRRLNWTVTSSATLVMVRLFIFFWFFVYFLPPFSKAPVVADISLIRRPRPVQSTDSLSLASRRHRRDTSSSMSGHSGHLMRFLL